MGASDDADDDELFFEIADSSPPFRRREPERPPRARCCVRRCGRRGHHGRPGRSLRRAKGQGGVGGCAARRRQASEGREGVGCYGSKVRFSVALSLARPRCQKKKKIETNRKALPSAVIFPPPSRELVLLSGSAHRIDESN